MSMTFSESYVLASKVRSKLTREASNPKSSLRLLVLQANMLDNLMDHIAEHTARKQAEKVSFALPEKPTVSRPRGPLVTEYELESDSDLDYDSESDFDSDLDSEDDIAVDSDEDDYYYLSEEEDSEVITSSAALATVKSYKLLPVMNLHAADLLVIYEEDENELPDLSRSLSDDSESEDDEDVPSYALAHDNALKILSEDLLRHHGHKDVVDDLHRHQRHNAIYLMEDVF